MIDYSRPVFAQLWDQFRAHRGDLERIIEGVNRLHQHGQMSSQEAGWNVVRALYQELQIDDGGYLGGEVILAPFDVDTIAKIPKTVYAFNPIFFVCESFEQMADLLDSYMKQIAAR